MKTLKKNYAWHFVGETLRDGRPIPPDGEWLEHTGDCIICSQGLHASRNPFDALEYAPGATLCLVEVDRVENEDPTKLVCHRRKIIARMDATDLCRYFARMQALSVSHLWSDPDDQDDLVLSWLMTGDESLRSSAWDCAWDSARASARASARDSARASAWDSARASAWDSARGSAWDSARDSARSSAWASARGSAWGSARDSAWASAKNEFTQLVYECFEDFL